MPVDVRPEGSLKPGDKVIQVRLAEALDVSRPTVREALKANRYSSLARG